MDEARRQQITEDRFARWGEQCAALAATPIILLAVAHDGRPGPVHVFVPHHDPIETALMVQTFRQLADELEAHGPRPYVAEGR